jgi:hypothetical protein
MFRRYCIVLTAAVVASMGLVGCGAPCDNYCDSTADYIEFCLENGSQAAWTTAATAGWSNWGAADRDTYVGDCKDDVGAQAAASSDQGAFEELCTDDSNRYTQLFERGFCADLP